MNLSDLQEKIPSWVKWTALAVLLIYAFGMPGKSRAERKKCQQLCSEQGFAGFRYKPYFHEKTGPKPSSCHCLTLEETQIKKRIPQGTKIF